MTIYPNSGDEPLGRSALSTIQRWATASSNRNNAARSGRPLLNARAGGRTAPINERTLKLGGAAAAIVVTLIFACAAPGPAMAFARNSWTRYSNGIGLISYQLPSSWQVQSEHDLETFSYFSSPYPTYAVIGGAEPATLDGVANPPSDYAFSETPSPWLMVLVVTGASAAPSPEEAYQIAPNGLLTLQVQQGLDPRIMEVTKPIDVSSGGLEGSEDRTQVVVPGAGDLELNEVVYAKGKTVWIAMVGCTVACYNANAVTLRQIIDSVTVGTASITDRP
jgi:hypothetical protein